MRETNPTRDIEREVHELERMDYRIERAERELERARMEAASARSGIVWDALSMLLVGFFVVAVEPELLELAWARIAGAVAAAVYLISVVVKRIRMIRKASSILALRRAELTECVDERVVHARRLEELSGGLSVASGAGGELTSV